MFFRFISLRLSLLILMCGHLRCCRLPRCPPAIICCCCRCCRCCFRCRHCLRQARCRQPRRHGAMPCRCRCAIAADAAAASAAMLCFRHYFDAFISSSPDDHHVYCRHYHASRGSHMPVHGLIEFPLMLMLIMLDALFADAAFRATLSPRAACHEP